MKMVNIMKIVKVMKVMKAMKAMKAMNRVGQMVLLLHSFACALKTPKPIKIEVKNKSKKVEFVKSRKISPGEVIRVHLPFAKNKSANIFYCRKKKIMYHSFPDYNEAFISESYFSKMKSFNCYYADKWGKNKQRLLMVSNIPKEFPSERLRVDKKRVTLSKKDLRRFLREKKVLNKVYAGPTERPLFVKGFALPLNSKVTSIYGSKRVFNNSKVSQHLGTDFRAMVGTPIKSSNAGKVVLARDLFFTGNTVIVDHGLGIFTVYGHLSKINVHEGEKVIPFSLLGLAGATGRVSGPHLHWGVKVNGNWIEGSSLVEATN